MGRNSDTGDGLIVYCDGIVKYYGNVLTAGVDAE
jgi:hypothetical protein